MLLLLLDYTLLLLDCFVFKKNSQNPPNAARFQKKGPLLIRFKGLVRFCTLRIGLPNHVNAAGVPGTIY